MYQTFIWKRWNSKDDQKFQGNQRKLEYKGLRRAGRKWRDDSLQKVNWDQQTLCQTQNTEGSLKTHRVLKEATSVAEWIM